MRANNPQLFPETVALRPARNSRWRDIEEMPWQGGEAPSESLLTPQYSIWIVRIFLALLALLVVRLFILQISQASGYRQRSEANRVRTQVLPAPRGHIIDRNGHIIVDNAPNFSVFVVPADLPKKNPERDEALRQTAAIAGLSVPDLKRALLDPQRRATDPIPVVQHLPAAAALEKMISSQAYPWMTVEATPTRNYVGGAVDATYVGYIGGMTQSDIDRYPERSSLNQIGKTGLEKAFDRYLAGTDGHRDVERDVQSKEQSVLSTTPPQPGKTLRLGIDAGLQRVVHDRLQDEAKKHPLRAAAAVALDPNTGDILAMDSAPAYDNSWFISPDRQADVGNILRDPEKPLLNRVIGGQYPSGSIIKPLIAAAGLNEKVITKHTTVSSVGGFTVGADFFPDWKSGGHGVTNVVKALAESVNTFFYILGGGYQGAPGLGVDRIVRYLQDFGWGEALGIDIPGEKNGFLPTKDWRTAKRASPWMLGDTYHISIGQGEIQVTPLQVAAAYASIANGGTLYRPRLVTDILEPDGRVYSRLQPETIRGVRLSRQAIDTVREGMRAGVLNGSSRSLQSLPVAAAGKTGTAQFGNQGKTHSWYGVFAPYDRPQIVLVVIVEGGGEGNEAALPVAKDILQWYFTRPAPGLDTKPVTP